MKKHFILYAIILVAQACLLPASAQKLPNKQTTGVWAPADIKIDGRADEWHNTYQAFNTATEMYYTISNDDKNLYLISYITNPDVWTYKAMTGGITFIIKNNNKQAVSFRYPVLAARLAFAQLPKGEALTGKDDDPLIVKNNTLLTDKAKTLEVTGVSAVDSIVSINNNFGIKAAGRFDAKSGYVYELAIPLKYLGFITTAQPTFSYQVTVNGGKSKFFKFIESHGGTNADGSAMSQEQIDANNQRVLNIMVARFAATDFTGEYTLAKKP